MPLGRQFAFMMNSADSKIYPGRNGTAYMRHVWVYVPQQYVPGTAAPFIVVQDGNYAVWFGNDVPHAVNTGANLPGTANLPRILDNYIAAKKLPKLVVLFAEAGGGDAPVVSPWRGSLSGQTMLRVGLFTITPPVSMSQCHLPCSTKPEPG